MIEGSASLPRWGDQGRGDKALVIHRTLVAVLGEYIDTATWLDVGCGSGGIAAALACRVQRVIGVDPEPWPSWPRLMAEHSNLVLHAGSFDVETPPLAPASIEVMVCNQVYEHVADPAMLIRNLGRVLSPGGGCYFAGPNLLWPVEPHVFWPFVHWLPRRQSLWLMTAMGSRRATELDAFSSSCWRLRRWFRDSGFEVRWALKERLVAELRTRGFTRLAALAGKVPRWVYRVVEPVSPGFIYVLTKPGRVRESYA